MLIRSDRQLGTNLLLRRIFWLTKSEIAVLLLKHSNDVRMKNLHVFVYNWHFGLCLVALCCQY